MTDLELQELMNGLTAQEASGLAFAKANPWILLALVVLTAAGYTAICRLMKTRPSALSMFRLLIVPVFAALALLFGGMLAFEGTRGQTVVGRVLESVMLALRCFALESVFKDFWEITGALPQLLPALFHGYLAFLDTLAPLLTISMALSLFTVPRFYMRLYLLNRRDIVYVFSDLNERAVNYARALQAAAVNGGKRCIVVFCSDEEHPAQKVDAMNVEDAVVLHRSVDNLFILPAAWANMRRIHFYLITEDENRKIAQARVLQEAYQDHGCQIICVSSQPISDYKVDEMNRRAGDRQNARREAAGEKPTDMIRYEHRTGLVSHDSQENATAICASYIELLQEASDLVYMDLYRKPLVDVEFLQLLRRTGCDTVRVLVLGAGVIGRELARVCLWYFQLPGLKVEVTVADRDCREAIRSRILSQCRDFEDVLARLELADRATIRVVEEVDFASAPLEDTVLKDRDFHKVFICTGDDEMNYRLALQLRRYYLRAELSWGCPEIRTVIWSDSMKDLMNDSAALKGTAAGVDYCYGSAWNEQQRQTIDKGKRYFARCPVHIFGSMQQTIEGEAGLRMNALRYHSFYSGNSDDNLLPSTPDATVNIRESEYHAYFSAPEGDRRSNVAIVVHGQCKAAWYEDQLGRARHDKPGAMIDQLAQAEHIRWCIFKLLEGDYPVPEGCEGRYLSEAHNPSNRDKKDPIRGYHVVLRSWNRLRFLAGLSSDDARWESLAKRVRHYVPADEVRLWREEAAALTGQVPDEKDCVRYDQWLDTFVKNHELTVFSLSLTQLEKEAAGE